MPRKRLFCQENDTRSGRRFASRLYPSHGPLRFITSHLFRARLCHAKNEAPEEEAGTTQSHSCFLCEKKIPVPYVRTFSPGISAQIVKAHCSHTTRAPLVGLGRSGSTVARFVQAVACRLWLNRPIWWKTQRVTGHRRHRVGQVLPLLKQNCLLVQANIRRFGFYSPYWH